MGILREREKKFKVPIKEGEEEEERKKEEEEEEEVKKKKRWVSRAEARARTPDIP